MRKKANTACSYAAACLSLNIIDVLSLTHLMLVCGLIAGCLCGGSNKLSCSAQILHFNRRNIRFIYRMCLFGWVLGHKSGVGRFLLWLSCGQNTSLHSMFVLHIIVGLFCGSVVSHSHLLSELSHGKTFLISCAMWQHKAPEQRLFLQPTSFPTKCLWGTKKKYLEIAAYAVWCSVLATLSIYVSFFPLLSQLSIL